jgi:hypothetical protein
MLCLAAALPLGCPAGDDGRPIAPLPEADRPLMPHDLPAGGNSYFLVVRVKMITISVPVGTASRSEELWSRLNEEKVTALRSANLGRNGLRVGVVARRDWDAVARLLVEMTGRPLKTTTLISRPGDPLAVALKTQQGEQTVFLFHDDRTLTGRDYPPGDNLITLTCTLNEEDPSQIMITGLPQIRTTERRPRFVGELAHALLVYQPDFLSFHALTFQVAVASRDVLVIGPGAESARPSSVGHRFLLREVDGVAHETVLVLIPEVFGVEARGGAR